MNKRETMKYFYLMFIAIFLLSSCSKHTHPKEVYEAYLADVQKIENLSEFPFSSYLSKRAQEYTAEKMERAGIVVTHFSMTLNGSPLEIKDIKTYSPNTTSEKMSSIFLKIWKSEALMPTEYSEEWQLGDQVAEWQFVDNKFLDPDTQLKDSTLKTSVHFVNEGGWKIDKIERMRTSKDGSTIKSITY
ncbi:MAG: hypothetical protein ACI9T7_002186 [Oleiphilaceae bacterium]|jgi:hypothetical protein